MAEGKIPGLGDVIKTVANLALYQQRVAEGKTSDGVIYLVLAERKVFFNGEDWTEGGGKIEYRTFLTGVLNSAGRAENLASLNAFLEGKALLYYPYVKSSVTHNLSLVGYNVVGGAYVFRFDYEDTTLRQILVTVNADGTASEDILIVEKIFDPKLSATSTNAPQTKAVYAALQGKQDAINDLDSIRSGASKGTTAVQPGSLAAVATSGSYNDLKNKPAIYAKPAAGIPKSDLASDVQTSLGKADSAISQTAADERYIRKTVDDFDSPLTFAIADGIVGTDDEYYFLPDKAPSTASDSQILATKADVAQGGGGGGAGGGGGSMDAESEEVIAAAFNDMNKRMDADKASFATKKALAQEVANLVSEIEQREEVTAAALANLDTRLVASRDYLEQNYITSEGFAEYMANLTAEIQDNERVIAAALTDINARLSALMNG